jgi:hypothetical protein
MDPAELVATDPVNELEEFIDTTPKLDAVRLQAARPEEQMLAKTWPNGRC